MIEFDFDVKAFFQGRESRGSVEGINRLLKLRQKFHKIPSHERKFENARKLGSSHLALGYQPIRIVLIGSLRPLVALDINFNVSPVPTDFHRFRHWIMRVRIPINRHMRERNLFLRATTALIMQK
jgi:hypothetical protein